MEARKIVKMTQISNLSQGDGDIASYYDKLSKYWEEFDAIKKIKSYDDAETCICCKESDEETQEDKAVKFLMG